MHEAGCEGVPCPASIPHCDVEGGNVKRRFSFALSKNAFVAEGDQAKIEWEALDESGNKFGEGRREHQQGPKSFHFAVIEFENGGAGERLADGIEGVAVAAEIDIEEANGLRGRIEERIKSRATAGGPLDESAEADAMEIGSELLELRGELDMIISDILNDTKVGFALGVYGYLHCAGGMFRVALDELERHSELLKRLDCFCAEIVISNAAAEEGRMPERSHAAGEVGWSATELRAGWEEVPEQFAER